MARTKTKQPRHNDKLIIDNSTTKSDTGNSGNVVKNQSGSNRLGLMDILYSVGFETYLTLFVGILFGALVKSIVLWVLALAILVFLAYKSRTYKPKPISPCGVPNERQASLKEFAKPVRGD